MLLPKLLALPLLLFLPRPSLLRPSGFAQMFNNWQSLQNRENQFAFESAQGNRPDFPIREHENDFGFESAQGNRQQFPIFNSPTAGNPRPGVSDPEGPRQPGGPTLPNSYLPPPAAPPIYFQPAEMNRQSPWTGNPRPGVSDPKGPQQPGGPAATHIYFPPSEMNRQSPWTGNPRPGVSDPEGPQQPGGPASPPSYFPPSESEQGNDFGFESAQGNRPDFPIREQGNDFAFESAQGNRPDFPIQGQGNGLNMAPSNEGDYTFDDGRQYNRRGVHVGTSTTTIGQRGQGPRYPVNEMASLPDPMSALLNRQRGGGRFNGRFANGPRTGGGFRRRPGGSQVTGIGGRPPNTNGPRTGGGFRRPGGGQVTGIGGRPPNTNGPRTGGGFRRRPVCIACLSNGPR